MNNFDINRFGKTLRWVVSVNFRKMLLWFAGSVLAVFLGEIVFKVMNPYGTPLNMLHDFNQFLAVILMLVSLIMVCSIVSTINEKRKREAFLMLPASNLEKYLSLMIYSTVICIAAAFLAVVLGDLLRMFAYWASGYHGMPYDGESCIYSVHSDAYGEVYWWSSSIPMLIENMIPNITNSVNVPADLMIVELSLIVGLGLWFHSIYTLGGTLLRKYSFVATSAFMILCITIFIKIVILELNVTIFHTHWNNGELQSYEIGILGWVIMFALPIISVLNYWASFHIFKGFELITNKWFNYDFYKR